MIAIKHLIASAAIALTSASAHAQFETAGDLHRALQQNDAQTNAFVIGYIMGVHDALYGISVCSPNGLSGIGLLTLTSTELSRNQLRPASMVLGRIMSAMWPCRKQ